MKKSRGVFIIASPGKQKNTAFFITKYRKNLIPFDFHFPAQYEKRKVGGLFLAEIPEEEVLLPFILHVSLFMAKVHSVIAKYRW